jgi:hypothetical protein
LRYIEKISKTPFIVQHASTNSKQNYQRAYPAISALLKAAYPTLRTIEASDFTNETNTAPTLSGEFAAGMPSVTIQSTLDTSNPAPKSPS